MKMNFKLWLETLKNPYHLEMRDFGYIKHNPSLLAKTIKEFPDDIWYHGTTSEFDVFKTTNIERTTVDWNARIGVHFTSIKEVAHEFASGLYKNKSMSGNIITAKLHVDNPKHYYTETIMANEAVAIAYKQGFITKDDFQKVLTSKKRTISSWEEYRQFLDKNEPFEKVFPEKYWNISSFGLDVMYVANSRKKDKVANIFKNYLLSKGFDCISYINRTEGFSNVCIIVFDPNKIEIINKYK